jgi:hypothetical protein
VVSVKAKKACDDQQDFAVNWAIEGFAGIAKKKEFGWCNCASVTPSRAQAPIEKQNEDDLLTGSPHTSPALPSMWDIQD